MEVPENAIVVNNKTIIRSSLYGDSKGKELTFDDFNAICNGGQLKR